LETDEINKRAAAFDDPFEVTRQNVSKYRISRKVDIDALRQSAEHNALNTGLAKASVRVGKLSQIASRIEEDLFDKDKFWLLQIKGVGSGELAEIVEYYDFNRGEIETYRGVLDDIAKETGGRIQRNDITSAGEAIQVVSVGIDVDKL